MAFVGSSNVSRSALQSGIEWNLRVDRTRDRAAYEEIFRVFDELWALAQPLTQEWSDRYAQCVLHAIAHHPSAATSQPGQPSGESTMRFGIVVLLCLFTAAACTKRFQPALIAAGPWPVVGYNPDLDTAIVKACAGVRAPSAWRGENPETEACGLLYRIEGMGWTATEPIRYRDARIERPNCRVPDGVKDRLGDRVAVWNIKGDFHGHPVGDNQLSERDLSGTFHQAGRFGQGFFARVLCRKDGQVFKLSSGTWEIQRMIQRHEGTSWETIGEAHRPTSRWC